MPQRRRLRREQPALSAQRAATRLRRVLSECSAPLRSRQRVRGRADLRSDRGGQSLPVRSERAAGDALRRQVHEQLVPAERALRVGRHLPHPSVRRRLRLRPRPQVRAQERRRQRARLRAQELRERRLRVRRPTSAAATARTPTSTAAARSRAATASRARPTTTATRSRRATITASSAAARPTPIATAASAFRTIASRDCSSAPAPKRPESREFS